MQRITTSEGLKLAILEAETEQALHRQQLKEQFRIATERLKPAHIFMSTLDNMASSPGLLDSIISTAVGLASGFLTRKLVVGASGMVIRKLVGSVLQLGVTNAVAQHPGGWKAFGRFVYRKIHNKKERESGKP